MFIKKIKKLIPERTKQRILLLATTSKDPNWMKYSSTRKKKIFVFLAGFYQNLGDMAITYAQVLFLKSVFPDAEIICVPSSQTYSGTKTIRTYIQPDDLITIVGGGNMDDVYISLEEARLHVVKSFPKNKIISFPQTFAFSDTEFGRRRQRISYNVYSKHKDLTLFVREPYSLERIKKAYPDVKIAYCPDIVLSLNNDVPKKERHGVLCCMRSDKEQSIRLEQKEHIIRAVKDEFHNVVIRDTVDVSIEECTKDRYEQTLNSFWDMLRQKEIVITDRLHCMIFCVITGTPCVVMDNTNHKISGVYNAWVREKVPFIRYVADQDPDTVIASAKEMLSSQYHDQHYRFTEEFAPLRKALHEQHR